MNSTDITQHIAEAEEALGGFLGTLLGEEAVFQVEAPEPVSFEEAELQKMAYLVVLSPEDSGQGFAVLLEPAWLPLLSKAMLGEAMEMGDEGAEDLMRELAGQGYGALRNQLGASDVRLPDVSFEVLTHGNEIAAGALSDDLWRVSFSAKVDQVPLGGVAFLSAAIAEEPAADPDPVPAAAPDPVPAAVQPAAPAEQPALAPPQQPVSTAPVSFPELGADTIGGDAIGGDNFSLLAEVELEVTVELGRRRLPLVDVLRLTTGSVIELENLVGEPLEVYANGRLIAEGEAVVIDEQFGVRITRLASDRQRTKAFL